MVHTASWITHQVKPEKMRVVFDCSAEFGQMSLNKQLLVEPNLTNQLFDLLIRLTFK